MIANHCDDLAVLDNIDDEVGNKNKLGDATFVKSSDEFILE